VTVPGHGGTSEVHGGTVFLAMALRNGGSGLAVIHGWRARRRHDRLGEPQGARSEEPPALDEFRQQQIDLYITAGDTGYWLGAMRDPDQADYPEVREAALAGDPIQLDLLYGDHEGGQRTIARFVLSQWPDEDIPGGLRDAQRTTVVRYWDVDRAESG